MTESRLAQETLRESEQMARGIIDMYQPRKRIDVGTWGIMGIGMGFAIGAAVVSGKPVIAIEGDSAFGFSGMELETICRYDLPVVTIVFNNNGVYKGTDPNLNPNNPNDVPVTSFVKGARYDKMIEAFGGIGYNVDKVKAALGGMQGSARSGNHGNSRGGSGLGRGLVGKMVTKKMRNAPHSFARNSAGRLERRGSGTDRRKTARAGERRIASVKNYVRHTRSGRAIQVRGYKRPVKPRH